MKNKLIYIVLLFLCSKSFEQSIIIVTPNNNSRNYLKKQFNFYSIDKFQTRNHIIFSNTELDTIIKNNSEVCFYEDEQSSQPSFILFPNDTLYINVSSKDSVEFYSTNKIRNNEIECLTQLYRKYGTLFYEDFLAQDRIPFANKTRKDNYIMEDKKWFATFKKHLPKVPATNAERDSMIYDIYQKRINFLNHYFQKNKISERFINMVYSYFLYRYMFLSIKGFTNSKEKELSDRLKKIISEENTFNDSLINYCNSYRGFLRYYNEYLTTMRLNRKPTESEEIMNADTSFRGKSRNHLLYSITSSILTKKVRNDTVINYFLKSCTDEDYTNIARTIITEKNIDKNEQKILIDNTGKSSSISYVIKQNKNKIVFIDFWASWCMPCMNEMSYSKTLSAKYKNLPVKFIYISMDDSKPSWKSTISNFKSFMDSTNSFILLNNFSSELAKKLQITTIPRYILIGKDGKVISADAPRPSDPKLKALLDQYINK